MSITLLLAVIFIVAALVGFKVYFEEKLEKAEKEINDAATEAAIAVEEPLVTITVEEPVKVEESPVVEAVPAVIEEKKKKASKKRYYRPNNKKKANKTK